ncbi:hypothetical protein LguiA_017262 [Lonicera macranthoides]
MAEEMTTETIKSDGRSLIRNSTGKRNSLDGGFYIFPHFRTSFASCNGGSNPRRNSVGGPCSSHNGKVKIFPYYQNSFPSSHDGGNSRGNSTGKPCASTNEDNLRGNTNGENVVPHYQTDLKRNSSGKPDSSPKRNYILPHYRTSFAVCNGGGNPIRNSSGKSLSSNDRDNVVPHYQTSLASCHGNWRRNCSGKPNSSNNRGSTILPHYRTSFAVCNGGGNIRRNSTGKPISSNNEENVVPHHQTSLSCQDGGSSRRNSTGKPTSFNNGGSILPHYRTSFASCNGGNLRRNSNGKQNSSNNKDNILPLHLRASTGSCHDFCKHSTQEAVEEKPKLPITKRKIPPPSPKHNNGRSVVEEYRKKTSSFKLKSSSDSEIHLPKSHKMKPKPVIEKPSLSADVSTRSNVRSNNEIKSGKSKTEAALKKLLAPRRTVSLPPRSYVSGIISLNLSKCKSLNLGSNKHAQKCKGKAEPKQLNQNQIKEKIIEAENEDQDLESVENGSSIQSPPPPSFSSSPKSSSSSHSISPDFSSDEEVLESEDLESEYSDYESDSEIDEFTSKDSENINVEDGKTPKEMKGEMVNYKDQDSTPTKLKFRRGKIVDLHSDSNNDTPRKLRFRRGRVLESKEDSNGNVRRRIFKKRGADNRNVKQRNSPKAEKVSLRHQDVEEKKDAQGLLNNVIEETASKLAESRKSKVKALVGAFETVFSFQEGSGGPPTPT